MKAPIPYLLSAWLILEFTFLPTEKVFSRSNQEADTVSTTDSGSSKPGETPAYVTGITSGRAQSLTAGVVGLISLVMGWRAKARSTGRKRTGSIVALGLGLVGMILSVVHLSTSVGAVFGSGSGKAGAIVALALSLLGLGLGGLAFRSSKPE
jgi:hypothetical protein